jgi:hypothetical protein
LVRELASLTFVETATNVLFLGPPGVGKTHLASALALKALEAGYSALFTSLQQLASALEAATGRASPLARLQRYIRPDILIVDEVGYTRLTDEQAHLLFELVTPRYPYCAVPLSLHPISALGLPRLTAVVRVFVPAIVRPLPPSSQLPQLPAAPHLLAGTPRRWLPAAPSSPASTAPRSVSVAARSGGDRLTSIDIHAASALSARS